MRANEPCPCGSGALFGQCCLALHAGDRQADTAEQLMRSRYSGYAVGDLDYVWRTWHPRTRPDRIDLVDGLCWTALRIVDVVGGQCGDQCGEVEFVAQHRDGALRERSRFGRRAGRWFYLDGDASSSAGSV